MHILYIPSWYPLCPEDVSGVFFRDQALSIKKLGHKVGVLSLKLKSLKSFFNDKKLSSSFEIDNGINTYRREVWSVLPKVPYGEAFLLKRVAKKLFKKYIDENGVPDIIHAHSSVYGGIIAVEIAKKNNIPVIITEHSSGFFRNKYKKWQLRLVDKVLDKVRKKIAVSPSLAIQLSERFATKTSDWCYIPNAVSDRFKKDFIPVKEKTKFRFLNLAIMTKNKGQEDLLEAFHEFSKENLNVELWFAGDGPLKEYLESKVKNLGLENRVRFLGRVSPNSVPELLNDVDIMVVSSHYETFGVVAAEALMAGLPVISTKCGGPECIVEKMDGYLIPVGDKSAMVKAMTHALNNSHNIDRSLIVQRAKLRFSSDGIAIKLNKIYERLRMERQ
jgi:glycosyltransferase involved in cell wall biosynthesis